MADDDLLASATAAIRAAWEEGCPVAGHAEALAPVIVRRWRSAKRRGVRLEDKAERVDDLTRGLIAHYEPDPRLVGPLRVDYRYLAEKVADSLLGPNPRAAAAPPGADDGTAR